jgi:rod shape-determining protein MreD
MKNNNYWKYILLFVVSVLLQVLFMNNLQFSGYVDPYVYILFLLLLPVGIPTYQLLLLGFLLGFSVDIFSNTFGIHASASVFAAFIRPFVVSSPNGEEQERWISPTILNTNLAWFLKYAAIMVGAHHFFLFFIEAFSFHNFFYTLLRSVLSSIFSLILIVLSQFIVFRK